MGGHVHYVGEIDARRQREDRLEHVDRTSGPSVDEARRHAAKCGTEWLQGEHLHAGPRARGGKLPERQRDRVRRRYVLDQLHSPAPRRTRTRTLRHQMHRVQEMRVLCQDAHRCRNIAALVPPRHAGANLSPRLRLAVGHRNGTANTKLSSARIALQRAKQSRAHRGFDTFLL